MSAQLGETAREILDLIKSRFQEHGLKLDSLNAYRSGAADLRRALLNGNKEPSRANLASVAQALFALVETPGEAAESIESTAAFWTHFEKDLNGAFPLSRAQGWNSDLLTDLLCRDCGLKDAGSSRSSNPFFWRKAITDPAGFFNRERELDQLRTAVTAGQPLQIVGPRRIGKTSLLLAAGRELEHWLSEKPQPPVLAHVDMMNAACHSQEGWLRFVSNQWGWENPPRTLASFSERAYEALAKDAWLVLCIDECEKFIDLPSQFDLDFFENLRSLSSGATSGFCILTASRISLKEIREQGGKLSPYYNTFQRLSLGEFGTRQATAFIQKPRPGVQPFTDEERSTILSFARNHPLKLQLACYHLLEARLCELKLDHGVVGAVNELRDQMLDDDV